MNPLQSRFALSLKLLLILTLVLSPFVAALAGFVRSSLHG